MKRRILTLLSLIFAMVGILAVITACKPEEEHVSPAEPTVVEEYYYDAAGSEYLLTLFTENKFKLEISPDTVEGEYALEGESLKLTLGDGSVIDATVKNKVVNMTYKEKVYNFLLKVDYTVSFDTLGGSSVAAVKVRNGKTVAAPAAPTKGEDVFIDWYTDKECKNLYYFSQPVTADLTLYARFVEHIDPEFTVKFETGAGASEIDDVTTTGGKLFHLPTPVKEGSKFVGWYVSQFYSAQKLSYRYEEQSIEENITLYAVWDDGNPVVSVDESGIEVETGGVNDRFSIVITAPDGTTKEIASQFSSNPYDFASMAAGEYKVSVTVGDKTTVRYFNNKALARVSVFDVEESTVLFNGVEHAQKYLLSVVCGTENHNHTEINLGTNRSWSFKNCDMPAGGISFVVKAVADGYVASESEPFDFLRLLDAVSGLSVDPATEVVSWSAVAGAKSYYVTVLSGSKEVFSGDVGTQTSFELKSYDAGEYTVKVKPVARGWSSPSDATVTYTKDRLAAPTGVVCDGKTVKWTASKGADKYVVTADGKPFEVTGTSIELSEMALSGKSLYSVSVRAQAEGKTDSLESDAITLRVALGDIVYRQGVLRWDPVLNASKYIVTVGDGEPVTVEGTSYEVTFTKAGDIKLSVSSVAENETVSSPKEITVKVYEITFDIDREGATEHPNPVYVADGDILNLPDKEEVTFHGYTFEAWYTAPKGMDGEGLRYDDVYFADGQNRTLYAGWTANVHTITFDVGQYGNDDLKNIKMTIRFGERITLPVAVSKDDSYTFSDWHFSDGTKVANFKGEMEREYLQDEDMVLYASYVLVFNFEDDPERGGITVTKGPGLNGNMVTEARVPSMSGGKPVTRIRDFTDCTSLEVLNIPDTVKLIMLGTAGNAFQGCTALREVNVYSTSSDYSADAVYSSDNGVLLYSNPATYMKEVRYFPIAKSGEYTVPDGVTVIPQGAFYGATNLTKLNISYTVAEIQIEAFNGCKALEAIEFLPAPAGISASPLDIRANAFNDCTALKSIHFPARLATVDASSLSTLTGLTEITVEAGGTYSAIDGLLCKDYEGEMSGKEVVFAPKGKDLGVYTIPVGVVSVGARAFYEHPLLKGIVIPGYVVNIASEAFGHITVLESIEFTGTVSDFDLNIQSKAFYAGYKTASGGDSGTNTLVTELRLPANLKTVGQFAFGKYTKLTEVWVDADRSEIEYADYVFAADSTTNISYVTTAHIGPACPAFSYSGVFGSKLATIDVDKANPYVQAKDDVVYDVNGANILFFPMDKGGDFEIPDGVLEIAPSAFADRDELVSISIPASVTVVGENAFNACDELTTVTFRAPEGGEEGQPLEIKQRAFYNCPKLAAIVLPDRLEHLGITVFYNCDSLTEIHLPKNLKTIDQIENSSYQGSGTSLDIFQGCDKLKNVTVDPENKYYSGVDGVLYATKALKKGSATASVTNEPYEALYASPGAEGTITVPGTVRYVRTYAFRGDFKEVKRIVFEDLVPIYDEEGKPDNTELTFQQYALYANLLELKQIGPNSYTIDYNSTLEEIVLPEGVKTLSKQLIYNWKGLTSITIPSTVQTIEDGAFYGCDNIASVTFAKAKSGVEEVPLTIGDATSAAYGVFSSYTSLTSGYTVMPITSIVLPARTKYIGAYAFYHSNVSSVTFDGKVSELQIGYNSFAYCEKLTDFDIPEGTALIGKYAFSYSGLTSIDMPDSVKYIGDYAFAYMKGNITDTTLTIPESTKMIGGYAFYSYDSSLGSKMYHFKTLDFSEAKDLEFIGARLYYNNPELTAIKFADATDASPALTIGAYAFSQLSNLKSVHLPANISKLGAEYNAPEDDGDIKVSEHIAKSTTKGDVFYLDSALTEVVFDTFESGTNAGKSMLSLIETQTFRKSGITSLTLPESIAEGGIELGEKLFLYCNSLTTVHLSKSVKSVSNVFTGCGKLQKVTVDADSEYFSVGKDANFPALYDAEGKSVLFVYKAVSGDITIASGTRIGAGAFTGQSDITRVVIAASVQEIGENAFADCVNLEEVQFEAGSVLTTIGEYAFQNCYNLKQINLEACTHLTTLGTYYEEVGTVGKSGYKAPYYNAYIFNGCDNLKIDVKITSPDFKNVGKYAFSYCGIKSVDISVCTSLTELNDYAFAQNDALTSVKFPTSLEFLGTHTFADSDKIETIDLSMTKIEHLSDVKGKQQTIMYLGEENLTNTSGAMTALLIFDCDNLKVIQLPETLRTIGYEAFMNSPALQAVYIGNGANDFSTISWFGPKVFSGSGISSIKIAGNATFAEKYHNGTTTSYYVGAFEGSTGLQKVEFVGGANLTAIPRGMFKSCENLTTVNFSALTNLETIGQDAFRGCGFTSVDLSKCKGGASFMTNTHTFAECADLSDITLPSNVVKVGNYTFMGTGFTSIDLAEFSQFTTWGNYLFQDCLKLTEVKIPASAKLTASAGTYMFDGCESLRTVTFEKGYKGGLPNYIFRDCAKLENLNLNDAAFSALGTYAFQNCTALKSIDLSKSTATALGNYMFDGCENLTKVTVPATIQTAGTYTFRNCTKLTTIDLSKTKINRFASTATGNVTYALAVHTFEGCTALEKVILPQGVTQIGGQVFLNCTSLTEIENLDISKLTHIGKEAFRNCAYISGTVTLNSKLTVLGEYAFADCYPIGYAIEGGGTITHVQMTSSGYFDISAEAGILCATGEGTENKTALAFAVGADISGDTLRLTGNYAIGAYFFENFDVEGVTKLDLTGLTATSLPVYALAGAPFTEIVLPDAMTELGNYVFRDCANLTTVHLPANLTTLGNYAFQNCVSLTAVDIPAGVTALPTYCFDGCTSLAEFVFPETITATGTYVFRNTGLTSITIPGTVENLGNYTFTQNEHLESVTFTGDVATVGTYLFQNCTQLTQLNLGPLTTLSTRMFQNTGLTSITIPETVTSVGNYAFVECHALKSATFAGTLETLGTYVFQNCEKLDTVKLPEGLTAVPTYAFGGCTALQQIEIPETVTSIGSHAFDGSGLTAIEISDAVDTIGTYAFQNCVSLKGDIVLSDNVTSLGTYAFNGCTGITSVELSANVGTLASNVFGGWTKAQEVRVRNSHFETCASCGVAWLKTITATVIFDYESEA